MKVRNVAAVMITVVTKDTKGIEHISVLSFDRGDLKGMAQGAKNRIGEQVFDAIFVEAE